MQSFFMCNKEEEDIENTIDSLDTAKQDDTNVTRINRVWRCGKLSIDKQAALFFSQLGISVSILSLCIYNLITHYDDCESNQLYSGLITMIVGIWTPSPKMKK